MQSKRLQKRDTVLLPNRSVLGSSVVTRENCQRAQANNHFFTLNCHLDILLIYRVWGVSPPSGTVATLILQFTIETMHPYLKMLDLVVLHSKTDDILVEKRLLSVTFQKHSRLNSFPVP